ncbi:hypothetical protein B0H14DRAFT_1244739 [Mycena olivaceomarginata]|nr:hypothetical protein B0H14DRAFT_1244739 [Mycena olivaceomarginata]
MVALPSCVVILDALDECKDPSMSPILSGLVTHASNLSPLKILITSRPQTPVTLGFSRMRSGVKDLDLNRASPVSVEEDIRRYLSQRLESTKIDYHLQEWPTKPDIICLAQLSSGLFIFASTAVRFIEDVAYSNPPDQLRRLINRNVTLGEQLSPYDHLDQLYTKVLTVALADISPRLLLPLKLILGAIVRLANPLSVPALEGLLELQPGQVEQTLFKLQSVIIVPTDKNEFIRLLHPSFVEFATRSSLPIFSPVAEQHSQLAEACLQAILKVVKRDICQVRDHSLLNSEVDDLPTRISTHILPHVQYSCQHWAYHVSKAKLSETLLSLLDTFCVLPRDLATAKHIREVPVCLRQQARLVRTA